MNKGASGFLPKNRKGDIVVDAIKSIASTGIYVNEQILRSIVRSWQQDQEVTQALIKFNISEREYEVIKLVAQQKSSNEIADLLGISARTVENHRKSIFAKTMTVSAPGLIIFAIKNNLLKLN
jgi:DNA-binding NarL/FixJ family response regulator